MLLNFNHDAKDTDEEVEKVIKKKGKDKSVTEDTKDKKKLTVGDKDLTKPFKEVLKCPFTCRIIKFSSPRHMLPANAKIYDDIGLGMLKACAKDPMEILKILRMGNESLTNFMRDGVGFDYLITWLLVQNKSDLEDEHTVADYV
ncbi:hypothetical protein Tco_0729673 [Tanacetum coccineum]|uniref:Uncharacterized protein n=1 Tax=Tanacetum coccineum TaxID=301880 RepID=A0ABQ4YSB2_9ASTR